MLTSKKVRFILSEQDSERLQNILATTNALPREHRIQQLNFRIGVMVVSIVLIALIVFVYYKLG